MTSLIEWALQYFIEEWHVNSSPHSAVVSLYAVPKGMPKSGSYMTQCQEPLRKCIDSIPLSFPLPSYHNISATFHHLTMQFSLAVPHFWCIPRRTGMGTGGKEEELCNCKSKMKMPRKWRWNCYGFLTLDSSVPSSTSSWTFIIIVPGLDLLSIFRFSLQVMLFQSRRQCLEGSSSLPSSCSSSSGEAHQTTDIHTRLYPEDTESHL